MKTREISPLAGLTRRDQGELARFWTNREDLDGERDEHYCERGRLNLMVDGTRACVIKEDPS